MARRWSHLILRHPRLTLLVTSVLAFVSLLAATRWLEIRPSRSELVFTGERLLQLKQAYRREFGDRDGIVIVVDASNLKRAKRFVSALGARLQQDKDHVTELFYRLDSAPFEAHSLQYLSPKELTTLGQKLQDHQRLMQDLATAPGLNTLFEGINREMGEALVGHFFTGFLEEKQRSAPVDVGFLNSLFQQVHNGLNGARSFASPWGEWLGAGEGPVSEGYLLTDDKRYLLLLADIRGTNEQTLVPKRESIERIRAAIAEVSRVYPGIEAGVTGSDALGSDEIVTARRDSTIATVLALGGVSLLFFLFWRGIATPLRALLSLAAGVSWTLGFIVLTIGYLNILTAMFIPILIGLGIDFNIHILERFAEERDMGASPPEALQGTLVKAGGSVVTAAVTTAIAFYALLLTDFKGLVELGLITGSGLLLCLVAAFTVLPALLILQEGTGARATSRSASFLEVFERWSRHPRVVIGVAGLLAVASLPALGKIHLQFNLLELQAEGTESVDWELRLIEGAETSTWYGIALARSPEEVRKKAAALEALPSVDRVQTIFSFLPTERSGKMKVIRALGSSLDEFPVTFGRLQPIDLDGLQKTFERIRFKLGSDGDGTRPSNKDLEKVRELLDGIRPKLAEGDPASVTQALATIQGKLFADLEKKIAVLRENLQASPMTVADLPEELRERFIGNEGTYLIKMYPRGNIWAREPVQEFVREVRSVDPNAIGDPITAWEYGQSMERGYVLGGIYAAIAMMAVILWSFGHVGHLLLALLPLVVGSAWTLGLMGLFGVNFNLANLIILPLIVGYGIMNGLHIVKRWQREGRKGSIIANSTGRAVFLSASTTMVGFGSLMVASHRGIFSLGFLLSMGVGSILLASLTVLPAVLWSLSIARQTDAGEEIPQSALGSKGSWRLPSGRDRQ